MKLFPPSEFLLISVLTKHEYNPGNDYHFYIGLVLRGNKI